MVATLGPSRAVAGIGVISALFQAVVPAIEPNFIEQVGRLGMVGLLAVAVIVLWRKVQEKDGLLMANYKSMADALATNRSVVEKMAETLERIEAAVDKLDNVRQSMHGGNR